MALWNKNKGKEPLSAETATDSVRPGVADIKNIIAIASGKGGVGKSTVSTNLAFALKEAGFKVGLMDADIYGPSQPSMLGAPLEPPHVHAGQLLPSNRHGMSFISMGLFLGDNSPVVWRAPMAMKMIQQFIANVLWGDLDYLLIDLPPGTGDVQLTLAQQAQLTGAVIVTTPQDVALTVARKGLKMFEQVNVPIIGIIENMSGFICQHCGQETAIFGSGGGAKMAEETEVHFLGSIPLDPQIMTSGEDGMPILIKGADSPAGKAYKKLAGIIGDRVNEMKATGNMLEPENAEISSKGELLISWPDGHESVYSPYHLRINCRCAVCIDENTGQRTLDPARVPLDIQMQNINPVGRYAISIAFSDGHNTGIFTFKRLRDLCQCPDCTKNARKETFEV
jgi:ATP-binding protein involved in chromosome partitioning